MDQTLVASFSTYVAASLCHSLHLHFYYQHIAPMLAGSKLSEAGIVQTCPHCTIFPNGFSESLLCDLAFYMQKFAWPLCWSKH